MVDLNNLEKYRENNRIEAKKALGGLPHSIWETYSAFANTLGGLILLGVEEHKDKSLHAVDLPDPERLVREFWELVNDPQKASANVLLERDVRIEDVGGNHIIVIAVPRAQRWERPVYVDGDPRNAYRRSGEGDYKCSSEELHAMNRDASAKTQDMRVLSEMDMSVFNTGSLRAFRQQMRISRPEHMWDKLDDEAFLVELGAAALGQGGKMHPTAAGLLMFGKGRDILREYPQYRLEYREESDDPARPADCICSSSGGWSGNVFDFYSLVEDKLCLNLAPASERDGAHRAGNSPVYKALREALANCLVHADYYGRGGLVIIKRRGEITLTNPGAFRIALSTARSGGLSDPRNGSMLKMFSMIDIGERSGSGIPNILHVWREQGWPEPMIAQQMNPDRTTLSLRLSPSRKEAPAIKSGDKISLAIESAKRQMMIEYLTDHPAAKASEIAAYVGLKPSRVKDLLAELIDENLIVAEGENRNWTYRLKA